MSKDKPNLAPASARDAEERRARALRLIASSQLTNTTCTHCHATYSDTCEACRKRLAEVLRP